MNILPKKRWHVRTKENIARVRRDEAKAAEEEKANQERIKLAESEARLKLLRERAQEKYGDTNAEDVEEPTNAEDVEEPTNTEDVEEPTNEEKEVTTITDNSGHINFFANVEDGNIDYRKVNKEHEQEKKEEREKYEKQIGYLTYLGQDTNEALGKKSWYNVAPDRTAEESEIGMKSKTINDPLTVMKAYLGVKKGEDKTVLPAKEYTKSISASSPAKPNKNYEEQLIIKKRKRGTDDSGEDERSSKRRKHKIKHKKKNKKRKKHKSSKKGKRSSDSSSEQEEEGKEERRIKLEVLRQERIKREQEERARAENLLSKLRGENKPEPEPEPNSGYRKQKYNSQFNPEIAKQNYDFHADRK